jgi:phosphatidylethanolamine-binding protein (PEBP) family uncharacterized protein
VFNLDKATRSQSAGALPSGTLQARNSAGHAGYDGPVPAERHPPLPVHDLRSCAQQPRWTTGSTPPGLLDAIDGKAIGRGTLVGTATAP